MLKAGFVTVVIFLQRRVRNGSIFWLTAVDTDQIVNLYSAVNRGIQNYYRFVDDWAQLSRVQYILELSLAKTLAQKFKISFPKVYKRFAKEFTIAIKGKGGKEGLNISFTLHTHLNQTP